MELHGLPHLANTAQRVPALSLGTALAWLGHEHCTCPKQVDERADVWLISPPSIARPSGMRALVDVEFVNPSWSRAEGNNIFAEINVCTCRDRIQVNQRNPTEREAIAAMHAMGEWLTTVVAEP